MAAKDNQGLQAIVIVLVILVILLGAGLIFVNNAKKTIQAAAIIPAPIRLGPSRCGAGCVLMVRAGSLQCRQVANRR